MFFAPQGRLVAPIHVKLGRADVHVGPLGCAKFHLNCHRRVGMRPQKYQKFLKFYGLLQANLCYISLSNFI